MSPPRTYILVNNLPIMPVIGDDVVRLVDECRRRGVVFTVGGSGFKCSAPAGVMTTELRELIDAHRSDIRGWLFAEVEPVFTEWPLGIESTSAAKSPPAEWPSDVAAAADLVLLLTVDDMPTAPFEFGPGRTVVDSDKFLQSIQADIKAGTSGPRSKLGSIQGDLLDLRRVILSTSEDCKS